MLLFSLFYYKIYRTNFTILTFSGIELNEIYPECLVAFHACVSVLWDFLWLCLLQVIQGQPILFLSAPQDAFLSTGVLGSVNSSVLWSCKQCSMDNHLGHLYSHVSQLCWKVWQGWPLGPVAAPYTFPGQSLCSKPPAPCSVALQPGLGLQNLSWNSCIFS